LQRILQRQKDHLNGVHIAAMLGRVLEFAEQDPVVWYVPNQRKPAPSLSNPMKLSAAIASVWDGDGLDDQSDWGMSSFSDEEEAEAARPAQGRGSRRPAPLSQEAQATALQHLRGVLYTTAEQAAKVAKRGQFDATTASYTLSCLAKLGYGQEAVLNAILKAASKTMSEATPAALTNTLWACCMLKHKPSAAVLSAALQALQRLLPRTDGQQLCTCVYALGQLGCRPPSTVLDPVCARAAAVLASCRPSELSNLAAGLAGMKYLPDDGWTQQYLAATMPRLRSYQLRDLHRTLASLSALNCKPDSAWLNEFYSACRTALVDDAPGNALTVRMMASMALSLARLNCRPDIRWMDVCLMRSRVFLETAPAADLAQLVCSLAVLRYRPGDTWLQAFLMAAFQRLDSLSPEQTVSMLQALARLGQLPQTMFLDELTSKAQARLQQFSGEQLADLIAAMARMRYKASAEWLAAYETATQGRLASVSAGGLTSMVWALAEMQHQPAVSWLYSFVLAAYGRLDAFDAGQLGVVFDALPRVSPTPTWLDELVQICASETSRGRGLASGSYDAFEDEVYAQGAEMTSVPAGGLWATAGSSSEAASAPLKIYGLSGSGEVEAVPVSKLRNGQIKAGSAQSNGQPINGRMQAPAGLGASPAMAVAAGVPANGADTAASKSAAVPAITTILG